MCGTDHAHDHEHGQFGFLVDTPEIRALIGETKASADRLRRALIGEGKSFR